jgi:hypothetical protein
VRERERERERGRLISSRTLTLKMEWHIKSWVSFEPVKEMLKRLV